MAYEVVNDFIDTDGKKYVAKDKYSKKLAKDRADILTTKENAYGKVFLKEVKEKKKK